MGKVFDKLEDMIRCLQVAANQLKLQQPSRRTQGGLREEMPSGRRSPKLKYEPGRSTSSGTSDLSTVKCYSCNKMGHVAKDCPEHRERSEAKELPASKS